jgi:uncharacterized protein (TIGR03086 family)
VEAAEQMSVEGDLELLAVARVDFKQRLELVGIDDWAKPTPCTEWDVRQLVNHVVGSDLRYTDLLSGGRGEDFTRRRREETASARPARSDPVADWERSGATLEAALRQPGAMERVVDYPSGPVRGRQLLENRLVDITIHTWDLARAIKADDTLDERLVRRCLSADMFSDPAWWRLWSR